MSDGETAPLDIDEPTHDETAIYALTVAYLNVKKTSTTGGGDGGAVKESTKHLLAEYTDAAEIDKTPADARRWPPFEAVRGSEDERTLTPHDDGS